VDAPAFVEGDLQQFVDGFAVAEAVQREGEQPPLNYGITMTVHLMRSVVRDARRVKCTVTVTPRWSTAAWIHTRSSRRRALLELLPVAPHELVLLRHCAYRCNVVDGIKCPDQILHQSGLTVCVHVALPSAGIT
jgi:hypothetical protein